MEIEDPANGSTPKNIFSPTVCVVMASREFRPSDARGQQLLTAAPHLTPSIVLGIRMVVCDEHHRWKVQGPLLHCSWPRGTGGMAEDRCPPTPGNQHRRVVCGSIG